MTTTLRSAAAVIATVAALLLAGCTAQSPAPPAAGATADPAVAQRFSCPTFEAVAALAAVPFTHATTSSTSCTYTTTDGRAAATVRHPGSDSTLAALRAAAITKGATTQDLPASAFDAFTAATAAECTASWTAPDGVVTSVTARREGQPGTAACETAAAVTTLIGGGDQTGPVLSVVAPTRLLGETTSAAAWPWRIAGDGAVRVDRLVGTGYLDPSSSTSFAGVAAKVRKDSAAVVIVSGTAEAGASDVDILGGVTAALSSAAVRAPDARLVVVGPVADGTTPYARLAALRSDLRSAARIAQARYLDPTEAAYARPGTASLDAIADAIAGQLTAAALPGMAARDGHT